LQKLDISQNGLVSLPDELSSMGNLKELHTGDNCLSRVPVSALRGMTALTSINLSFNGCREGNAKGVFQITSPLLPILHPGLVLLDLRQSRYEGTHQEVTRERYVWNPVSLFHLGRALIAVADRRPRPIVRFNEQATRLL
jgi:Leucine-rich repeat (LRR) protein